MIFTANKKRFDVINPFTQSIIASVPDMSPEDLAILIKNAVEGAAIMDNMAAHERSDILFRASEIIKENNELLKLIIDESGKAFKYAYAEINRAAQTFRFASEEAKRIEGKTVPMDSVPGSENRMAFYNHFPVGVIAAITPFNFPLNLVAHKVAPALASGNAVILKPSPRTPLTSIKLKEILNEAALPDKALSLLTTTNDLTNKELIKNDCVNMISFTGSAKVGKEIKQSAGIKKIVLELGANSAAIVEPDIDIDFAVKQCVTGAFAYGGQVCISLQRIYIHHDIYDTFKNKFLDAAKKIKVGDPNDKSTEYGPLISPLETRRCLDWINEAVKEGAKLECGGNVIDAILYPTVFSDVKPTMKIINEEIFGPVVSLIPYSHFNDAIAMSNDSNYGLQTGVFTNNIDKAFYAFKRLKVGGVIINDAPTYRTDHMPYGGVKNSGIGREGVKHAIQEMTEKKILIFNLGVNK